MKKLRPQEERAVGFRPAAIWFQSFHHCSRTLQEHYSRMQYILSLSRGQGTRGSGEVLFEFGVLDPSESGQPCISRKLSIRVTMVAVWVAASGNLGFCWFCLSPAQPGHSWPSLTQTDHSLHVTPKTHLIHMFLCRSGCSSLALMTSNVTTGTSLNLSHPSSINTEFCERTLMIRISVFAVPRPTLVPEKGLNKWQQYRAEVLLWRLTSPPCNPRIIS